MPDELLLLLENVEKEAKSDPSKSQAMYVTPMETSC